MTQAFATLEDLFRHLDRLGLFRMELSLGRFRRALHLSGLSHPPFPILHVVGTNGKGSTATFLEALLRAHGLNTGLYTSPHFVSVRERVRVNGRPAEDAAFLDAANAVAEVAAAADLTYFEFLTLAAARLFVEAEVDAAVMEAGLGGRFDAVTAFPRELVLFTPIGLDHMAVLGDTVQAIAADKAGALQRFMVAVSGRQPPEAREVLAASAATTEAVLLHASDVARLPADAHLGLAGPHQRDNAALALAGWRLFAASRKLVPDPAAERAALASAFIAGRLQRVPAGNGLPELILDGAHNRPALLALGAALVSLGVRPGAVVFSCLADKDPAALGPLVAGLTDGPVLVPPVADCPRAAEPAVIAAAVGPRAIPAASLAAALAEAARLAPEGPVLVCGSLYLLAEFYRTHPELL